MNKTVNYNAGDLVLKSGEFGKGFCILKSGVLQVKKGATEIAEIATAGAIFGEMSEILGKPRYVDVYAKTDASILEVHKSIEDLASTNPEITIKLIKTLARRLEDTTAKVSYQLSDEAIEEKANKIQILIVEDQAPVADEIGKNLAHTGWEFTFARSSERAIEFCERDKFNLIIISLGLPNESAFSLRRALRAIRKSAETPMLALVITGDSEAISKARQYGFNRQVTKPIDFIELEGSISQAIGIDPTNRYYSDQDNVSICTLPEECTEFIYSSFIDYLEKHIKDTVNKGFRRIIIDASKVNQADLRSADIIFNFVKSSEKLKLSCILVTTVDEKENWKKFEKTKALDFKLSIQEALEATNEEAKAPETAAAAPAADTPAPQTETPVATEQSATDTAEEPKPQSAE